MLFWRYQQAALRCAINDVFTDLNSRPIVYNEVDDAQTPLRIN